MFVILVIISAITLTNALEPLNNIELGDEKAKEVISKYMDKIPDIKEQLVIDERLSKAISHYFKGKISAFPLYKVSVKIDRSPIKIPWSLGEPNNEQFKMPRTLNKPEEQLKPTKYKENAKQDADTAMVTNKNPVEEIVQEQKTAMNKKENANQGEEATWEKIEKSAENIVPKKIHPKDRKVKKIYKMIRPTQTSKATNAKIKSENTEKTVERVETTTGVLPVLTSSSIKTTSE